MVYAYNPNTCKGETGEPEAKDHLELHNTFKASPAFPVSNINKKKKQISHDLGGQERSGKEMVAKLR